MTSKPIHILSRGLPKTGQTNSYAWDYDVDGEVELGWWRGRKVATNRQRFVPLTLNVVDKVVIDRATGLMWAADGAAAGCNNGNLIYFDAALSYAYYLNFAGFGTSQWRVPNILELMSIINYGKTGVLDYYPTFLNTQNEDYLTSTCNPNTDGDEQFIVSFGTGVIISVPGSEETSYLRCVRGMR